VESLKKRGKKKTGTKKGGEGGNNGALQTGCVYVFNGREPSFRGAKVMPLGERKKKKSNQTAKKGSEKFRGNDGRR